MYNQVIGHCQKEMYAESTFSIFSQRTQPWSLKAFISFFNSRNIAFLSFFFSYNNNQSVPFFSMFSLVFDCESSHFSVIPCPCNINVCDELRSYWHAFAQTNEAKITQNFSALTQDPLSS